MKYEIYNFNKKYSIKPKMHGKWTFAEIIGRNYMLAKHVTDGEQYGGVVPLMAKDSVDRANQ